jgi:regulator of ribosome biosynthesis
LCSGMAYKQMNTATNVATSTFKVMADDSLPFEIDAGFLTVTDINAIDGDSYKSVHFLTCVLCSSNDSHSANLEDHLMNTARNGVQTLIATLFSLPTDPSPEGPIAQLPPPTTPLPRAKPLPQPKAPTKWEKFAAAKGIKKQRKDRQEWDEETQEWVNTWGKDGKNNRKPWITEVSANSDA